MPYFTIIGTTFRDGYVNCFAADCLDVCVIAGTVYEYNHFTERAETDAASRPTGASWNGWPAWAS